jgi:uncharacterized RDD family membrane protein YckC
VALAVSSHTPWPTRVVALLIDSLAPVLVLEIGAVLFCAEAAKDATVCMTDTPASSSAMSASPVARAQPLFGWSMLLICVALSITFQTGNHGHRQGNTGSSIGKSVMKFQVVSEKTWKPIGFGPSVVRQLVNSIDAAISVVGYLFPLWDTKRQTIADKTMGTVCVPL